MTQPRSAIALSLATALRVDRARGNTRLGCLLSGSHPVTASLPPNLFSYLPVLFLAVLTSEQIQGRDRVLSLTAFDVTAGCLL
jgi:hypothetical protein